MPVKLSKLGAVATGVLLVAATDGPAGAQSIRSQLGAQARATISISASVKPMFTVSTGPGALNISSNASANLRYQVVVQPVGRDASKASPPAMGDLEQDRTSISASGSLRATQASRDASAARDQILLIVPD